MYRSPALLAVAMFFAVRPAAGQQRPLDTQDPEPIGGGRVVVESGVTYAHDEFYSLSGRMMTKRSRRSI
jgi:hypothetical protein